MSGAEAAPDFAALFEASADALLVADEAGKILFGNPAARRLLGLTAEELRNRTLQQLLPDALPPLGGSVPQPRLFIAHAAGGETLPVELTLGPFASGGATLIAVILRDAGPRVQAETALRASEANLNTAQRLARLGSWSWDVVTLEVEWSDGLFRMFGLRPGEFRATNDAYLQFIHPEDRDRARQAVAHALLGKTVYDMTYRVVWPDGTVRHVHDFGEVIRDGEGRALKMVGVVQDITERHRLREALAANEEEHRKSVNRLGDALLFGDHHGKK